MASIDEVSKVISAISSGIVPQTENCMSRYSGTIRQAILEQLYSGIDGKGNSLNPNYDNDPFFEQEGEWFHRSNDYKAWKNSITPPQSSPMLGLPPRSNSTPNLFINGKFYSEIFTVMNGDTLEIRPGDGDGPDIVRKWGEDILNASPTAIEYFINEKLKPHLSDFIEKCGYR